MTSKFVCISAALFLLFLHAGCAQTMNVGSRIDRESLVRRHNVTVNKFDPLSPLSVGNGEFSFTVDPTGLQTFPELYEALDQTPLCTMAQWGWHSVPVPDSIKGQSPALVQYDTYGRQVGYMTSQSGPVSTWHRENPHKLHLGRIGLELRKSDGSAAKAEDLTNITQTLDLWTGIITSRFQLEGSPVMVQTAVAGESDAVSVRVESPLLASGRLNVVIAFPYGSPDRPAADWRKPDAHTTDVQKSGNTVTFSRKLDADQYQTQVNWTGGMTFNQSAPHHFTLKTVGGVMEFNCAFAKNSARASTAQAGFNASRDFWHNYWTTGGAVDLSQSTDPRWRELERRIVLSQYLVRVNCASSLPPQETGLVYNSWYGKFHLEMHWWHVAHFPLWDRQDLFDKSMGYYKDILPAARAIAQQQGYKGARWPKMTDPAGRDSPSGIGPLLIWQQPHPIYYAEQCYRAHPDRATLEQWAQIVNETADFLADFAKKDPVTGKYNLGPPIKTVPEHTEARTTKNPGFELSYWAYGLRTAQEWRQRMGQPRKPEWDEVLKNLAPIPIKDGLYLSQDDEDTWKDWTWEHPSLIGPLGVLPGDGVDPATMKRTLENVMQVWQWDRCWGWDFPMTAMSAARVGRPDLAVDALLIKSPKNLYLPNGHNYQRDNLTLYLPGNGGLLTAVAMMCAGWDGGPKTHAPGFPKDGWVVKYENLKPLQ